MFTVQMGRGPFAPAATGLVKIGEIMTLVVSVEGDPGFDIQVTCTLFGKHICLNCVLIVACGLCTKH